MESPFIRMWFFWKDEENINVQNAKWNLKSMMAINHPNTPLAEVKP